METADFKDFAKAMVDYIADYLDNIRDRPVVPAVKPGYLRQLVPEQAPEQAEPWTAVMADIERVIMSGVTHWHSPKFHAYFPTANSYPAIVADMLSDAIACIGFTWIASPACTELEVVMLDWVGQMLGLPETFLARSGGQAGGVIQGTASEATLVALLGAKSKIMNRLKEHNPELTNNEILPKLVGYHNAQAHSSVERAGLLGGVIMRSLKPDSQYSLRGETLRKAIEEDVKNGLHPFYVVVTLGTTSLCSYDNLEEIGAICKEFNIWCHVDAAYAGAAFSCPEFRYIMKGIDNADSFNFNPHKWLLVNFDCSCMWLKEPKWMINAFNVDPLYLKHDMQGSAPDYRHWQIPLGRRFRSLKLWFVLRLYGVENIQKFIRGHVAQAKLFEKLCLEDERFEVVMEVTLGLVCFRLKGENETNEALLRTINGRGNIHLVPSKVDDLYFLRFAVCSRFSEEKDIEYSWNEIKASTDELLKSRAIK